MAGSYNPAGAVQRMVMVNAQDPDNPLDYVPGSGTPLPAGTDRSGTATTSSTTLIPANANRKGLEVQNIGANNIGLNEFGGTAAIGTAGTYTVAPGATVRIRTNRAVTGIAATASTPFTATEY